VLWPDFTHRHFYEAIHDYQQRERRFGRRMAEETGAEVPAC
jgi:undecaprenyl diphosphate synthase